MEVADRGHKYWLESLDGLFPQQLVFVKRMGEHYPGNTSAYPGTTMQEVLRCLLDRARYVNEQIPCIETEAAIPLLQTALALFEMRAKRVKGQHLSEATLRDLEEAPICPTCGHVSCKENHNDPRDDTGTKA